MKGNKGFTFIELLLAVILVSAAALLMYSFFGQGLRLYTFETESAEEQTNMRQVMSDITNKARLITQRDDISCVSGTLNIGDYSYTYSDNNVKRNGAVIASGIASFIFAINSDILQIDITSTSGKKMSTSLSLKEKT